MEDSSQLSWHLHITGRVQGIGFRPHVYRFAKKHQLNGWVSNDVDGVHIEFTSTQEQADVFVTDILETAPNLSHITSSKLHGIEFNKFDDFKIIQKASASHSQTIITPDFALCKHCKIDLQKPKRKDYPFISCSDCGPRYSILQKIPFERHHTSMHKFAMCDSCHSEYANHRDRRFYAQTISCPSCQIQQQLFNSDGSLLSSETSEILELIPTLWEQGKIIAIKGIGGFLLTCAAKLDSSVQELRLRKQRPTKPFAVMIPSLDYYPTLKNIPSIHSALESHVSPAVLCSKDLIPDEFKHVSDNLDTIGIMIPYAPLLKVLLDSFKQPIIATSGNVSNAPIIFDNIKALEDLSSIADYILINDRDIVMPQDDSVITYTPSSNQKIIVRRSRGIAPSYLDGNYNDASDSILCLGAELKSTFCISHQTNIYISQYMGNLINFETQNHFSQILENFIAIIKAKPSHICIDIHPEYFTTSKAYDLAQKYDIPVTTIQHHKAHFASILGEHKLLDSNDKILGVIWDGTGLGDDGMIWGSEFFVYQDYTMTRCAQLDYYSHFLNEKMALEPRISVFAILYSEKTTHDFFQKKFTAEEWRIYSSLIDKEHSLQTSSMGRIFDAVASILGLMDKQSFEGEAAMLLETAGRRYVSLNSLHNLEAYKFNLESSNNINAQQVLLYIIEDINAEKSIEYIAAKFHMTLVNWILAIADLTACSSLAFSGGVFQNGLLVDLLYSSVDDNLSLYFHKDLSPNDENISFGQYIYYQMTKKLEEKN